ncbi:protein export - membrane protein [Escherichia coli P12b]|nr:protein export - membrane protein [Escherichia coli P12b]
MVRGNSARNRLIMYEALLVSFPYCGNWPCWSDHAAAR